MFTGIYRLSINQFNIVWGGGGGCGKGCQVGVGVRGQ